MTHTISISQKMRQPRDLADKLGIAGERQRMAKPSLAARVPL